MSECKATQQHPTAAFKAIEAAYLPPGKQLSLKDHLRTFEWSVNPHYEGVKEHIVSWTGSLWQRFIKAKPQELQEREKENEKENERGCEKVNEKETEYPYPRRWVEDFSSMCSYIYVTASPERLTVVSKLYNLAFLHDAIFDDERPGGDDDDGDRQLHLELNDQARSLAANVANVMPHAMKHIMKILAAGGPVPFGPEAKAVLEPFSELMLLDVYAQLAQAVKENSTPEWHGSFCEAFKRFALAQLIKMEEVEDLDEWIKLRCNTSGVEYTTRCIPYASGCFLPLATFSSQPELLRMERAVILYGSLGNELMSFDKEVRRDNSAGNILHWLMRRKGMSFEDAVRFICEKINNGVSEFEQLEASFGVQWGVELAKETGTNSVRRYLSELRDFLNGSWGFMLETGRYRFANSSFVELEPYETD